MKPASQAATVSHRNNQLAQIHMARADLMRAGVIRTEDEYRDLLAAKFCGRRSAAELNDAERLQLLDHFQRLGWKGRVGGSRANSSTAQRKVPWSAGVRKLWSLWQQLADAGLVTDRTAIALSSWCHRQTAGLGGRGGVERVEWLNKAQLHSCTEAAKLWLARGHQVSPPGSASVDAGAMAQMRRRLEDRNRQAMPDPMAQPQDSDGGQP